MSRIFTQVHIKLGNELVIEYRMLYDDLYFVTNGYENKARQEH